MNTSVYLDMQKRRVGQRITKETIGVDERPASVGLRLRKRYVRMGVINSSSTNECLGGGTDVQGVK